MAVILAARIRSLNNTGLVFLALTLVACLAPASLMADDWPWYRGPAHNGKSKETSWSHDWNRDVPAVAWRGQVGTGCSSCVIGDGRLFTIGNEENADTVFHIDANSGESIWRHTYDSATDARECGYSSPLPIRIRGKRSLVFGSGRVYVSVDPETGNERWRQRWLTTFGCNAADPIVFGDQLFLSSGYNRGSALLDLSDDQPTIVWKHKQVQPHLATSVLVDGYLYGASGDVATGASLTCMELATVEIRWKEKSLRVGGISAAGDRLLLLSDTGQLKIVRANNQQYEQLAKHQVFDAKCWTAPVLANGQIYCLSADGKLVAIKVPAS